MERQKQYDSIFKGQNNIRIHAHTHVHILLLVSRVVE